MAHQIEGAKSDGTSNSGGGSNAVKIGGVYQDPPATYSANTRVDAQMDFRGNLKVTVIPTNAASLGEKHIITLRAAATASANVTIASSNFAAGVIAYFNIASFPASASTTVALKIRAVDPVTGSFSPILNGAARSVTGTTIMMIGPGISASALGIASLLPRVLSFLASFSTGATSKDVVFSIGLDYTF